MSVAEKHNGSLWGSKTVPAHQTADTGAERCRRPSHLLVERINKYDQYGGEGNSRKPCRTPTHNFRVAEVIAAVRTFVQRRGPIGTGRRYEQLAECRLPAGNRVWSSTTPAHSRRTDVATSSALTRREGLVLNGSDQAPACKRTPR